MAFTSSKYDLSNLGLEDYEENELVLNTVDDLTQFFNNSENCTCHLAKNQKDLYKCYEKIGFKQFFQWHLEICSLEKTELDLFLKAQLLSFEVTNNESKLKNSYKYNFNASFPICKTVYLKLNNITEYKLSAIQKHLQEDKLRERIHGNTGYSSKLSL